MRCDAGMDKGPRLMRRAMPRTGDVSSGSLETTYASSKEKSREKCRVPSRNENDKGLQRRARTMRWKQSSGWSDVGLGGSEEARIGTSQIGSARFGRARIGGTIGSSGLRPVR